MISKDREFDENTAISDGEIGCRRFKLLRAVSLLLVIFMAFSSVNAASSLRQGDEGSRVLLLQKKLIELGYPISADGKYGMATLEAVKSFQKSRGLYSDGIAGERTFLELNKAQSNSNASSGKGTSNGNSYVYSKNPIRGTLKLGDNASSVGIMQRRLIELNYPIEKADLVYGKKTMEVVKLFQKLNGLTEDGKAGRATLNLMFSDKAKKYTGSSGGSNDDGNSKRKPNDKTILKLGDSGKEVLFLQKRLLALNYQGLTADGKFGKATENALKLFQMKNGLKVDGKARVGTLERIYSDKAVPNGGGAGQGTDNPKSLRLGDSGREVLLLQKRLKELNYPIDKIDGVFGKGTESAVKLFQANNRLYQDGVVGGKTREILNSSNAVGNGPGSTPQNNGSNNSKNLKAYVSTGRNTKLNFRLSPSSKQKNIVATLVNGTELDVLDKGSSWCKVAYNGRIGYVMTKFISFNKASNPTNTPQTTPVPNVTPRPTNSTNPGADEDMSGSVSTEVGSVYARHWFSEVKPRLRSGMKLKVYHPISKKSFTLNVYSCGRHLDAEPATKEDTQILNSSFGKASWNINPVYVKLPSGEWSLATMHNMPHLSGSIKDNDFDGHLCVHFLRDLEETQKHDPNYGMQNQKAIRSYFKRLK